MKTIECPYFHGIITTRGWSEESGPIKDGGKIRSTPDDSRKDNILGRLRNGDICTIVEKLADYPTSQGRLTSAKKKKYEWYKIRIDGPDGLTEAYVSALIMKTDESPVCLEYVWPYDPLGLLIASFNSGAESGRVFNEVHYYANDPHITLGFGHFAGGTQNTFLRSLLEEEYMRDYTVRLIYDYLVGYTQPLEKDGYQLTAQEVAKDYGYSLYSYDDIVNFLKEIDLEEGYGINILQNIPDYEESKIRAKVANFDNWQDKMDMKKNSCDNPVYHDILNIMFPGGGKLSPHWLNNLLVYMFNDKYIRAWQIHFWAFHEEGTLSKARNVAMRLGLEQHYGAMAALASWKSSGYNFCYKEIKNAIDGENVFDPATGKVIDADLAAFNIWLGYNRKRNEGRNSRDKKPETRNRQIAIFNYWFDAYWDLKTLTHKGGQMETGDLLLKAHPDDLYKYLLSELKRKYDEQTYTNSPNLICHE